MRRRCSHNQLSHHLPQITLGQRRCNHKTKQTGRSCCNFSAHFDLAARGTSATPCGRQSCQGGCDLLQVRLGVARYSHLPLGSHGRAAETVGVEALGAGGEARRSAEGREGFRNEPQQFRDKQRFRPSRQLLKQSQLRSVEQWVDRHWKSIVDFLASGARRILL